VGYTRVPMGKLQEIHSRTHPAERARGGAAKGECDIENRREWAKVAATRARWSYTDWYHTD
jgi:hypothetical protein